MESITGQEILVNQWRKDQTEITALKIYLPSQTSKLLFLLLCEENNSMIFYQINATSLPIL